MNDKNGNAVTSDHEKAGLMNTFFVNVGEELAARFPSDNTENKMEHFYHVTPTVDHIIIYTNKLNKDLRKIKPNKASGHDNNSPRDFAAASDALTDGLNNVIFQKSLHLLLTFVF